MAPVFGFAYAEAGAFTLARDKCFLTAYGRVKSGLKPAVKNRAMHGGEECAARMVKTKADALGIGGQSVRSIAGKIKHGTLTVFLHRAAHGGGFLCGLTNHTGSGIICHADYPIRHRPHDERYTDSLHRHSRLL